MKKPASQNQEKNHSIKTEMETMDMRQPWETGFQTMMTSIRGLNESHENMNYFLVQYSQKLLKILHMLRDLKENGNIMKGKLSVRMEITKMNQKGVLN